MHVIVHYPKSAENIRNLQKRVAKIHAQAIVIYIQKLPCTKEQKIHLVKDIEKSILEKTDSSDLDF